MNHKSNTPAPTPENFERATKLDQQRQRNLDRVVADAKSRFSSVRMRHFFLMGHRNNRFSAFIFFDRDENLREAEQDGTTQAIVDYIYDAIERFGRGERNEISIHAEFDSDENVQRTFGGNYLLRLH